MAGWDSLYCVLAEAKALDLGCGEIVLEDDGEIGIEWAVDAHRLVSVSVRCDGRIGFAALIDGWKAHGASEAHIPDELIIAFRKIAAVKQGEG